jgi:hypothetical protein
MAKDALGNDIEIGRLYGYSQQSNGTVSITKGIAEAVNEETHKVRLNNVESRKGLWGVIDKPFSADSRKVSVNACHVFPINELPF